MLNNPSLKNISNSDLFKSSPYDFEAVKELIKSLLTDINVKEYCKLHNLNYSLVINMLSNKDRNYTATAIDILKTFNYTVTRQSKLILFDISNTSQLPKETIQHDRPRKTKKMGRAAKTKRG